LLFLKHFNKEEKDEMGAATVKRLKEKTVYIYQCGRCRTKYEHRNEKIAKKIAKKCASMPNEKKVFKKGDRVTSIEPRSCFLGRGNGTYRFKGAVTKIVGPEPPDYEYCIKWLKKFPKEHMFLYEITYKCPNCGEKKKARYFAPELKKIK